MKSRNIHLLMCIAFLAMGTTCAQSAQAPALPPAATTPNLISVIPTRTPWITITVGPTTTPVPRTSTPVPPTPAPIEVLPPGARTGIREIDDVIAAALANDPAALRKLVRYTLTGCTKAEGLGGPPKCESGEVEGTRVEVFPILGSEGGYVRCSSIDRVLQFNLKGLYGVYRVPANAYREDYWPAGRYGLVLIGDDESAMTLLVGDGGIVRIVYHLQPLEMALAHDVGDWLLPPATVSMPKGTPTP